MSIYQINHQLIYLHLSIYLFILMVLLIYEPMSSRLVSLLLEDGQCVFLFSLNGPLEQRSYDVEIPQKIPHLNKLSPLFVSIAEIRVSQRFNEPTGRPAAVCCILLAYAATRLPSSKLLLVMKAKRSTCNYSTPVVCLHVDTACQINLMHHSQVNKAFKAFAAKVEIWTSKIISNLRLVLIKVLSTFAELRAGLEEGWRLDKLQTLSHFYVELLFQCLTAKIRQMWSDSALPCPVRKTLVDLMQQTSFDKLLISWLWAIQSILFIWSPSWGLST